MACILRPECNFLSGYFRCLLPVEMVDVEVSVKMMLGIHMFWKDRTLQIINCNSWSTRLHPYPSLVQKMRTYFELEGKLGPKPRPQPQTQLWPTQPQPSTISHPQNTNPMTRKPQDQRQVTRGKELCLQREGTKGGYSPSLYLPPQPQPHLPPLLPLSALKHQQ